MKNLGSQSSPQDVGSVGHGITGASAGQYIKITAVDNDGKPTEFGADSPASGGASVYRFSGTLTVAGWTGNAAPYSQTVSIQGLLATDVPTADVTMSGTYSTDESRSEEWSDAIYRGVPAANAITFYAHYKPAVELPFQLEVIR